MRSITIGSLIGIIVAVVSMRLLCAQAAPVSSWQEIRNHQPAALHLKMTLAKDHFYQGEKIDATLDFSNDEATKPYSLAVGAGARGAVFHATDEKGNVVPDPLQWRKDWYPMVSTGPVGLH